MPAGITASGTPVPARTPAHGHDRAVAAADEDEARTARRAPPRPGRCPGRRQSSRATAGRRGRAGAGLRRSPAWPCAASEALLGLKTTATRVTPARQPGHRRPSRAAALPCRYGASAPRTRSRGRTARAPRRSRPGSSAHPAGGRWTRSDWSRPLALAASKVLAASRKNPPITAKTTPRAVVPTVPRKVTTVRVRRPICPSLEVLEEPAGQAGDDEGQPADDQAGADRGDDPAAVRVLHQAGAAADAGAGVPVLEHRPGPVREDGVGDGPARGADALGRALEALALAALAPDGVGRAEDDVAGEAHDHQPQQDGAVRLLGQLLERAALVGLLGGVVARDRAAARSSP